MKKKEILIFIRGKDTRFNAVNNLIDFLFDCDYKIKICLIGSKKEVDESCRILKLKYGNVDICNLIIYEGSLITKIRFALELIYYNLKPKKKDKNKNYVKTKILFVGQSAFLYYLIINSEYSFYLNNEDIRFWAIELPLKYRKASFLKRIMFEKGENYLLNNSRRQLFSNQERVDFMKNKNITNEDAFYFVFHNYPLIRDIKKFNLQLSNNINSEKKYICLSGVLDKYRCPENFLKAVCELYKKTKIKLLLAGWPTNKTRKMIEKYNRKNKCIDFIGSISKEKLFDIQINALFGCAFYFGNSVNNALCAPQKIYEYLLLDIPILTSDNISLKFVNDRSLGMSIRENDNYYMIYSKLIELTNKREFYKKNIHLWKKNNLSYNFVLKELKGAVDFILE